MPDNIVTVIVKYYVRASVSRRYRGSTMESELIVVKLAGQAGFAFSIDIMGHMLLVIRGRLIKH